MNMFRAGQFPSPPYAGDGAEDDQEDGGRQGGQRGQLAPGQSIKVLMSDKVLMSESSE